MRVILFMIFVILLTAGNALSYSGQRCNFGGDCDLNEQCKTVPYYQRDGSSYRGICVPRSW